MSHCEEPDEEGGCTNCGKCGKTSETSPLSGTLENYLTRRDSIRFQTFLSETAFVGKRLLVLGNTIPQMPSALKPARETEFGKMRDQN